MSIPNHDWAKKIAEPTTETIDAALRSSDWGRRLVDKMTPLMHAALHRLIRIAIADELDKLSHRFAAKHDAIAPDNAAYWCAERATQIRNWRAKWCVVTTYPDDSEDEQPFTDYTEAVLDTGVRLDGMDKKLRMR